MAHKIGDGYFDIQAEDLDYDTLMIQAGAQVLGNMEKLISVLVASQDVDALHNLQGCVSELFRRAAECAEQGATMEIDDDDK